MGTQCMTPFTPKKKLNNGRPAKPVPCGKCPGCLARRASGWSFRLMMEDKRSVSSFFITFTYDTNHIPISKNGFMSLSIDDMQKCIKRIRKAHDSKYKVDQVYNRQSIRYYLVGEYGGKYKRPHYHLIVFNLDLKLMFSDKDRKILEMSNYDGKAHVMCKQWDKGIATVGTVSGASVGYTLKYMTKARWRPMHKNDDRLREFSLMSKGLGDNYLTDAIKKWHIKKLSDRMYLQIDDGKKIAMPRYYKQKIYTDEQRAAVKFWTEKRICENEKKILQSGKIETAKNAKARVDEQFARMYKRANESRPLE